MVRSVGRKLVWVYALLMLVVAFGYARFDVYLMDGDGTAFLDIAQALRTGHSALAINGYWNPGYPAVLAVAEKLAHPSLWNELIVVRYADLVIFLLTMAASLVFTTGLTRARQLFWQPGSLMAIPDDALHLLGLGLLVLSLGRELPIAAPRSDTLLLLLFLLAMGLLLRLRTGAGLWAYPVLGVVLGAAYLTKSFALLPSVALIAALFVYGLLAEKNRRPQIIAGTMLTAALFALIAGPYILAISRQLGHLTTGDSARLNYAFFIDGTERWHESFHGTLGHATGPFTHPEALIANPPPVFSYAAHPLGTFPLWFDPAWWTAGLKPHIYLPGELSRMLRNCVVFVRYLLGRPEPLVLLAVMLAFAAAWPRLRRDGWHSWASQISEWLWALAPLAWGLLMLGIYFPVDLQDRYLTGPFLLVLLPLFAMLRARSPQQPGTTSSPGITSTSGVTVLCSALIVLFAFTELSQSVTYLAERRRQTPTPQQRHPGFDPAIFPAAAALDQLGLQPGDKIACMGDRACYTDHYWARLAGTQILAEVETPGTITPQSEWDGLADPRTVTNPLKSMGLKYIVTRFEPSARKPDGWVQLGHTDFFAYPLQQTVTPQQAASIAAFDPQP